MATRSIEVERKFDVTPDLAVPDLSGVPGVAAVRPPVEHLLEAIYYDTSDLRLQAAGTTLRRRTGGADAGWHLKTPAGPDRQEVRIESAAPPADVPAELVALVRSLIRRARLVPVATLSTRRT
ncbi:MAG: hypothetical protein JWL64_917, partial [Frankiales bacterium]|nr:hypothetical protein [Frankiales bacterium]